MATKVERWMKEDRKQEREREKEKMDFKPVSGNVFRCNGPLALAGRLILRI